MTCPDPAVDPQSIAEGLQTHLAVCEEVLRVVEQEHQALQGTETYAAEEFARQRKTLLPRLTQSLECLSRNRAAWQRLDAAERARHPGVAALLRTNQDLIMRVIVLDRENEQALLRRGLVPPRHLPPADRQRPHVVAGLYQRAGRS